MRSVLLYLAGAGWSRSLVTNFFLARRAARRFVAGETLDEAVAAARQLNTKGMMVSLDHLGESVHNKEAALSATADYLVLLDAIYANKLDANVSVKLTQLGLDIDESLCVDNMRRILAKASEIGTTVNIDMESSAYTEITLKIFRQLNQEYQNIGTVIQAYLYRSEGDMQQLAQEGGVIRLCKGAYKEPADVAFPEKADVDANYMKLTKAYLSEENRQHRAYLKVATHDPKIIQETIDYAEANGVKPTEFEFQMLYGIRTQTQLELVEKGYRMRVYVPYGTEWYPYFMRRLAERPANIWFIMKNLFTK
ncbi:MAG: proline dehydrogenase family protein [Anaerolineales bacterium]|nr:proline dehydrogenase family protein [Anaerolineales bacterium]